MLIAAIEKTEDAIDLYDAKETLSEYERNPVSYTLEEIKKNLAFNGLENKVFR